jgi:hypothetical protein
MFHLKRSTNDVHFIPPEAFPIIPLVSAVKEVKTITKEKSPIVKIDFFIIGDFILLFDFHMLYDVLF